MGNFSDAINQAAGTLTVPNFDTTRRVQKKVGIGLSAEQTLSKNMGGFLRVAAHDGKTETFSFTEIDRSLSAGVVFSGGGWTRVQDKLGVAWAVNGLSSTHRAYAAAGGMGFFIGDGKLNYKPETIAETYYLWSLGKQQISANFQWIKNPAYNADRGPVQVYGVRWHTEF
jgi:carbohydrate-selective porin OprB